MNMPPAQQQAFWTSLAKFDTPQGARVMAFRSTARHVADQLREQAATAQPAVPAQPPTTPSTPATPDPNAYDPNETANGGQTYDRTKDPDYGGNTYVPPAVDPQVPAEPPTGDATDPNLPNDPGAGGGTPFPEATRGRAYYGIMDYGGAKVVAFYVFDPGSLTYKPRRVTPAEWQKVTSTNRQMTARVMDEVRQAAGGPNFTIEAGGDVVALRNIGVTPNNATQPQTPAVATVTPPASATPRARRNPWVTAASQTVGGSMPNGPAVNSNSISQVPVPTVATGPTDIRTFQGKQWKWDQGASRWAPFGSAGGGSGAVL